MIVRAEEDLVTDRRMREEQDRRRMNNSRRDQQAQEASFRRGLRKHDEEQLVQKFKEELKEMTSTTVKEAPEEEGSHFCPKQQYYYSKFKLEADQFVDFREGIRKAYLEGLAWVCAYYNQGCCSWSWFYPYHYAPYVSDLLPLRNFKPQFQLG